MIQYRAIGGTLDLYFFSGPTPRDVIQQYGQMIGLPTWMPMWAFGFHLCRWGYANISELQENVAGMRAANIPLESMSFVLQANMCLYCASAQWSDIDLYQVYRDFTTDEIHYPGEELRQFIQSLVGSLALFTIHG